jgi:signal peptidase I
MLQQRILHNFDYPRRISVLKRLLMGIVAYFVVLMCALTIVVYVSVFVQVSGNSMNNSLYDSEYVLVNRYINRPALNDVVVVKYGAVDIIKRVVALPGDTVMFEEDKDNNIVLFYRNGSIVQESYIKEPMTNLSAWGEVGIGEEYNITVPDGCIFVMGDNRNDSLDSRSFGCKSYDDVKGAMYLRLGKGSWLEWIFKFVYGVSS